MPPIKPRQSYVYIMTNATRTLYVCVTSDLVHRVYQHRQKLFEGFTKRYNITWLVYYEEAIDIEAAIAREKQIKGWRRERKVSLIESVNSRWRNLAKDWYDE